MKERNEAEASWQHDKSEGWNTHTRDREIDEGLRKLESRCSAAMYLMFLLRCAFSRACRWTEAKGNLQDIFERENKTTSKLLIRIKSIVFSSRSTLVVSEEDFSKADWSFLSFSLSQSLEENKTPWNIHCVELLSLTNPRCIDRTREDKKGSEAFEIKRVFSASTRENEFSEPLFYFCRKPSLDSIEIPAENWAATSCLSSDTTCRLKLNEVCSVTWLHLPAHFRWRRRRRRRRRRTENRQWDEFKRKETSPYLFSPLQ